MIFQNKKARRLAIGFMFFMRIRTKWVLSFCFILSLAALVVYLIDLNYSDTTLFILLLILRYLCFILCVFAFYKLMVNIYHMARRPDVLRALSILLYLFFIAYGIFIIFIESFIVVIAGGNT
jgi:hypothetical protein